MKKTLVLVVLHLLAASLSIGCASTSTATVGVPDSPPLVVSASARYSETPTPTNTPLPASATPVPATPTVTSTPTPLPAAQTLSPTEEIPVADIRAYLDNLSAEGGFSGVVLVDKSGEIELLQAYGLADRELELPNQVDTKFNLGSLDKMFTAVAIMQLVEQGQVSLQETVGTALPDYPDRDIADNVTIHQLLTHTSGMGNYFDSPHYLDDHDQLRSLADYFALFEGEPLLFEPGSQFGYSNSGFIVLGLIVEAVSGMSYYDFVRENIFEPAGMPDTAAYELDAGTPNLAVGYTTRSWEGEDTGQISDNESMLPVRGGSAGGGYSTATDLLAFANALQGHRLLGEEQTGLVTGGKVEIAEGVEYGYGFFNRYVRGQRVMGHGGGFPGICSMLNIYPELDLTTVVLSNSDYGCVEVNDYLVGKLLP